MDSVNPLVALCALLPILYVSGFVHELGHAVMAHAVGFTVTSFGMGVGRPLAVFSLGLTRIYFCGTKPLQGIAFCLPPKLIPPRRQMVPYLAGGIIANTLFALLALALYRWLPWGTSLWHTASAVNAMLAVINLVPFQVHIGKATLTTDGGQIFKVLRDRVVSVPEPQIIQALKTFRELWRSIRNHTMLRLYVLSSAAAYAEMTDFARGESILSELDSLEPSDFPTVQAREAMVRGTIQSGVGRLDEAEQSLLAADALFETTGDDGGQLFTAMHRLWLRISRRDLPGALDDLSTLHSHRLFRRSSWIQAIVHAFCV
jgi:Zn-dependent protease